MSTNIMDFVINNEDKRVRRFSKLSKGKSAVEKRKLEEDLLKPTKLPPYAGPEATAQGIEARTVRLSFPDDASFEAFGRHFKVSHYIHTCISQTSMKPLLAFVRLLEKGRLVYDAKNDKYNWVRRTSKA